MSSSPNKLLWGATISAHAVEGRDFDSDWWRWEQRPRRIQGGATSEVASAHLEHYAEDLSLARKIGLNALQYSVSWARIEPQPGHFDENALAHYAAVFSTMVSRGITPIAVLQEHSLPAWFAGRGGWCAPSAARSFVAYVARLYEAIGPHCRYWIPLFEPALWTRMAYGERRWPRPASRPRLLPPGAGVFRAVQREVGEWLMERDSTNEVGVSLIAPALQPSDPHSPWDCRALRRQARLQAWHVSNGNAPDLPCSFIALSCPGRHYIHCAPGQPGNHFAQYERQPGHRGSATDPIPDAAALGPLLKRARTLNLPILLTSAGLATEKDSDRCHHLLGHVHVLLAHQAAGLPLLGFCYRSLLDGFEWHHGFTRRYGLIHVDRESLVRTPNPSAFLYQDIAQSGTIRPGVAARFAPGWETPIREAS